MIEIRSRRVDWELQSEFRIAYKSRTHSRTLVVELRDGDLVGRGEALGVSYRGESVDTLAEQLAGLADELAQGMSRTELQTRLPAGGARNAVDCALWDIEAKRTGRRAWELAGIESVRSLTTAYTLGLDTPEAMGRAAASLGKYAVLKLKLAGEGDLERVLAVRKACPRAVLIVDANEAWSEAQLHSLTPQLAALDVKLIEQPLPSGRDEALEGFHSPIPICADESCQTAASLPELLGRYQFVNIKLDKTGGLTAALDLAREARKQGLGLMVGCMSGSSLSMAPAFVVGQLCTFVDLDGPLLAKSDVPNGICYEGSTMHAPQRGLWG